MNQAVVLLAVGWLASKIIELLKYLANKNWNAAGTLVAVWIAGIVVVFLAGAARVTSAVVLPGLTTPLKLMDTASKLFVGLTLTSLVSGAYDFKKALDRSDSAAQPALFPRSVPPRGS